jgi:hypothetical protein
MGDILALRDNPNAHSALFMIYVNIRKRAGSRKKLDQSVFE